MLLVIIADILLPLIVRILLPVMVRRVAVAAGAAAAVVHVAVLLRRGALLRRSAVLGPHGLGIPLSHALRRLLRFRLLMSGRRRRLRCCIGCRRVHGLCRNGRRHARPLGRFLLLLRLLVYRPFALDGACSWLVYGGRWRGDRCRRCSYGLRSLVNLKVRLVLGFHPHPPLRQYWTSMLHTAAEPQYDIAAPILGVLVLGDVSSV